MKTIAKGIVHYVSTNIIIASFGASIFISKDNGTTWNSLCRLNLYHLPIFQNRWISRLLRAEVVKVLRINNSFIACFALGKLFIINLFSGESKEITELVGSRILGACVKDEKLYFGDYSTTNRSAISNCNCYDISEDTLNIVYSFSNIRHIHGVFLDKYEKELWVTTGDSDHESAIIRFDDKMNAQKIIFGSQQARAVDLLFTEDSIFYATDAPDEPNFIYRIDRHTNEKKRLQQVGGPVFWGRKEKEWLFFSTVVEPSKVNRTDAVELWGSNDQGNNWKLIKEFKKDMGHLKLFQYGQIKFPAGPGDGKNLWFSPYATENDHYIMRMPLDEL